MAKKTFTLITFFLLPIILFADSLKIFFLNVGEGESIYIESKEKKILIDSGNPITGYQVLQFLKKRSIKSLDALIITHPHPDHMGGVFHILQELKVDTLYDNGEYLRQNKADIYRWYSELFRQNNRYRVLKQGLNINIGKNTRLISLSPDKLSNNWNENSLVFKLSHGKIDILLMGDAGILTEQNLLTQDISLQADLLKIGHHGAHDASSEVFLKAVNPSYAIISTNKNNIRGYPSPKILERLQKRGIKVYSTYEDGDIVFELDEKSITKTP